jgi:hypothetical protein
MNWGLIGVVGLVVLGAIIAKIADTIPAPEAGSGDSGSQNDTQVVNSDEPTTTKVDFILYEEFFDLREQQLKKMGDVIANLSESRHQELISSFTSFNDAEWRILNEVQDSFYNFEKKLDEGNPLHQLILQAIDSYTLSAAASYQDWLITGDDEAKNFADIEKGNGDKTVETLKGLLKEKGWKE